MNWSSAHSQFGHDRSYLIDLAALKAYKEVSRERPLSAQDRMLILDAVIVIVESGYGRKPIGGWDLYDVVTAAVVRFRSSNA